MYPNHKDQSQHLGFCGQFNFTLKYHILYMDSKERKGLHLILNAPVVQLIMKFISYKHVKACQDIDNHSAVETFHAIKYVVTQKYVPENIACILTDPQSFPLLFIARNIPLRTPKSVTTPLSTGDISRRPEMRQRISLLCLHCTYLHQNEVVYNPLCCKTRRSR